MYYKPQKNGWRTIFLRTGTEGRLFAWQRLKNSKTEAEPTEKMKIKKMKKKSLLGNFIRFIAVRSLVKCFLFHKWSASCFRESKDRRQGVTPDIHAKGTIVKIIDFRFRPNIPSTVQGMIDHPVFGDDARACSNSMSAPAPSPLKTSCATVEAQNVVKGVITSRDAETTYGIASGNKGVIPLPRTVSRPFHRHGRA